MKELTITQTPISQLHGYANNPKQHNRRQLRKIADSIREFGFINPILVDENFEIIAGHGRMAAAHDMGMRDVPMIILSHLTDAPYNVKVKSIGSMCKIKHDEFAMVSGDMTQAEFTEFLRAFMRHTNGYSMDGALHYLFMDWKHVGEISTAGAAVYNDFKNICIWNKTKNGVLNISDNNHLILKAFATAWKYREIYEECGDVDTVARKVGSTPRTIYRYLDIAYMNPELVNNILSAKKIYSLKEIFAIALRQHLSYNQ